MSWTLKIVSYSLFWFSIFQVFHDLRIKGFWSKRSYSIFDGAGMFPLKDICLCVCFCVALCSVFGRRETNLWGLELLNNRIKSTPLDSWFHWSDEECTGVSVDFLRGWSCIQCWIASKVFCLLYFFVCMCVYPITREGICFIIFTLLFFVPMFPPHWMHFILPVKK